MSLIRFRTMLAFAVMGLLSLITVKTLRPTNRLPIVDGPIEVDVDKTTEEDTGPQAPQPSLRVARENGPTIVEPTDDWLNRQQSEPVIDDPGHDAGQAALLPLR